MTPETLLAECSPEVRAVVEALRAVVRDALPDARERAYPGWRGIGYRDPDAGYVCGIFPQADHTRLLFEHGARLPDPQGLLEGEGVQTRYVVVRPGEAVPEAGLRRLVMAALHERALRGR